jgi:hypothetical protein
VLLRPVTGIALPLRKSNLVRYENDNFLPDPRNVLNRWKNSIHRALNETRQREVHTDEPVVSGPSCFELWSPIVKLKMYESPGIS